MGTETLESVLAGHRAWLVDSEQGAQADLMKANLGHANLRGANLSKANLSGGNLRGANLIEADLSRASLSWANLSWANLSEANLIKAHLRGADLSGANLSEANLSEANLSGVSLRGANLIKANLRGANLPSPQVVLACDWGAVSDELCLDLMRYDAESHPDHSAFGRWAEGGKCPYTGVLWERAANFREDRKLWSPGRAPTAWKLAARLLREYCQGRDELADTEG